MTALQAEQAARNRAVFLEDLMFMIETGETTEGAAERFGISPDSLHKRLTAKERQIVRPDLWEALRRNEIRRYGATLGDLRAEYGNQWVSSFGVRRRAAA